ncbi:MAG: RHS repeat-associated core domain-containing protein [Microthrixaceae bacterium]
MGGTNKGNATSGSFTIDPVWFRPNGVTWSGPGGAIAANAHTTRLEGNVVDETIDGVDAYPGGENFEYDNAGRLVGARVLERTAGGVGLRSVCYDFQATTGTCGVSPNGSGGVVAGRNSNRVRKTTTPYGGVAGSVTYSYDLADRLTSTTDPVYGTVAYDSHGNVSGIAGETHTYDMADRHVGTVKGATSVSYGRDATDRVVERKVGSSTVARYSYSAGGDTADLTLNSSSTVVEATLSLPGGVLYTYRPSTPASSVWSYPNLGGSVMATATQAGVKQGNTLLWDPDGNPVAQAGLPDNTAGNWDYGWHGGAQRPLEHETGLLPTVEMGARQYIPGLGRFIEVDPIEGGTPNDYIYPADPIGDSDLNGEHGLGATTYACRQPAGGSLGRSGVWRGSFGGVGTCRVRVRWRGLDGLMHSRFETRRDHDRRIAAYNRRYHPRPRGAGRGYYPSAGWGGFTGCLASGVGLASAGAAITAATGGIALFAALAVAAVAGGNFFYSCRARR